MLKWPEKLKTQITGLDMQHKKLVAILDKLCAVIKESELNHDAVKDLLHQLTEDEMQYFTDEKQLIQETNAHEKLAPLQHMNHCSFIYDLEKMHRYFAPEIDIMEPEKTEMPPAAQILETALKIRHQYEKRNAHFKQQLAKCFIDQQLTECLHKNFSENVLNK
jgi:hemerythrin